jgi:hypothetical protein
VYHFDLLDGFVQQKTRFRNAAGMELDQNIKDKLHPPPMQVPPPGHVGVSVVNDHF